MAEPKLELKAILDNNTTSKIHYPITILRYALLEVIDSPFLRSKSNHLSVLEIIPTWYIMTAPANELANYNSESKQDIITKAFEKADSDENSIKTITEFVHAFTTYLIDLQKIMPDSASDANTETKGKKAQTAS